MLTSTQIKESLDESYLDVSLLELRERYNIFVADCETAWCDGVPSILLTLTSRWSEDILVQLTHQVREELNEKGLYPYRCYSLNNRWRYLLLIDDRNVRKELSTEELQKRQQPLLIPKRGWREGSIAKKPKQIQNRSERPSSRNIQDELKYNQAANRGMRHPEFARTTNKRGLSTNEKRI